MTQINDILENTLEMISYDLRKSNLELVKEMDPALPLIKVDFWQMQQVFLNLVTNAIHAMPRGGTLSIDCRLKSDPIVIVDKWCCAKTVNQQ